MSQKKIKKRPNLHRDWDGGREDYPKSKPISKEEITNALKMLDEAFPEMAGVFVYGVELKDVLVKRG